jgi:hypothetical protein
MCTGHRRVGTAHQKGSLPISSYLPAIIFSIVAVDAYVGNPCGQIEYVTAALTDSAGNGTYAISGVPAGNYFLKTIFWPAPPAQTWNPFRPGTSNENSNDCNRSVAVPVTVGATSSGYDFQLEAGGYVSGRVVDSNQNPIAGLGAKRFPQKTRFKLHSLSHWAVSL